MFDYDPFSKRQNDCFKNVQVESTIESLPFSDDGVWKMSVFLSNVRILFPCFSSFFTPSDNVDYLVLYFHRVHKNV